MSGSDEIWLVRHGATEWTATHQHTGRTDLPLTDAGFADAEVLADLQEWDYGVYEGRTTAEIRAEVPGWSVWRDPVVEGESIDDVAQRAGRVLDRVAAVDGRVVLFAHAHILRILTACALGLPATTGRALGLDAASISVLGTEHDYRVVRRWNWTP